ncbi:hypothetical protein MT389_20625, partial [Aeromonas salmonicida]
VRRVARLLFYAKSARRLFLANGCTPFPTPVPQRHPSPRKPEHEPTTQDPRRPYLNTIVNILINIHLK